MWYILLSKKACAPIEKSLAQSHTQPQILRALGQNIHAQGLNVQSWSIKQSSRLMHISTGFFELDKKTGVKLHQNWTSFDQSAFDVNLLSDANGYHSVAASMCTRICVW